MGRRSVFYSFYFKKDSWRVSQVRNIGVVDASILLSDHDWEEVARGGDKAIQAWIDSQMRFGRGQRRT
jgi:hypothetical protein